MTMWKNQQVLVTGGAGFIGSHLTDELVSRGAEVTIVDDLRNGSVANLAAVSHQISLYRLDVGSEAFLELLEGRTYDTIFHLASNSYVPPSVRDPWRDFENTLLNTLLLLERLRRVTSEAAFLYASSAAVYGDPVRLPISEDDPTVPISPYGVSKLAAERYVHVYSQLYGIRAASCRFFSVYGPRQSKQVVYDFLCKLHRTPGTLCILGDGQQVRDFLYVKDAVRAMLLVVEEGPLTGEVYNVAGEKPYTIQALARTIARMLNLEPDLVFDETIKSGRAGDPDLWVPNTSKLHRLGFEPKTSLEQGLRATIDWFSSSCD